MGVKKEYRQDARSCQSVETGMLKWEPTCRGLGIQWLTVEQPKPICKRSAAMGERRTWVNIAVCPCLHSPLTHNRTSPFRKYSVRDLYFCKEVYYFVYWSCHYRLMMFPHISVYLYMYTCNCIVNIQQYMWLVNILLIIFFGTVKWFQFLPCIIINCICLHIVK